MDFYTGILTLIDLKKSGLLKTTGQVNNHNFGEVSRDGTLGGDYLKIVTGRHFRHF